MKKIIYLLPVILLACAPGKSGETVRLDVYCDSCYIKIINRAKSGSQWFVETAFDGNINGYKSINISRFDSDLRCTQISNITNYSTDSMYFFVIENNDTIEGVDPQSGYCF